MERVWAVSAESVRRVWGKFGGPIHCWLDGREALLAWVGWRWPLGPLGKGMNDPKAGATTTLHFLHKCFADSCSRPISSQNIYTYLVHFFHAYFTKVCIFTYPRLSMSSDSKIYTYKRVRDDQDYN